MIILFIWSQGTGSITDYTNFTILLLIKYSPKSFLWSINITPGRIGLKFDIFELMFYEILVMHTRNSHLVYNLYEQAIKLFLSLSFTCFM